MIFTRVVRWQTHQTMSKADGTPTLHFERVIQPTIQNASQAAPYTSSYILVSHDPNLTSDRVLTAGAGIIITDGGAKGNIVISTSGADASFAYFMGGL